ncbi:MAG: type I DNA topoisomerase [Patescibacteria group bacterium]
MNLVIVESPAKAKTIEKFLGKDYKVLASFGHVRDLPQKSLGINVEKNYAPEYSILPKAKKTISDLKGYADKADIIYLATDLDREGEAISWHLAEALKIKDKGRSKRIVFHEITKSALEKAVQNPRDLDMNLVDAQQARRVLDRLVGYKLSPFLWKKVKAGLSAGRVQSVAVRLVVEKEREIIAFKPREFWVLGVDLSKQNNKKVFSAYLVEIDGKGMTKYDIGDKKAADLIEKDLKDASYKVLDVKEKESIRKPSIPFTTSALQIEASRKLGFSPKQTMMLAQHLYEAGHITYMRTDSTNLSDEALSAIQKVIIGEFGQNYLESRKFKTKAKHAQEAHEAIRPSHFENKKVTDDARGQRLYDLIWRRTVASQMKDAIFTVINARISAKTAKEFIFLTSGEKMKFDGFMKVYVESSEEEEIKESTIPALAAGEILDFHELIKDQKFTEPPKRYSEAMLVKKLEGLGIGRPSTYAPTLETIQHRGYVILEEKRFKPQEIGMIVTDLLVANFPQIVDYKFTAEMEDELDDIADGKREWVSVIDEFYKPFEKNLEVKSKEINKKDIIKDEILEEKCPECGEHLVIKLGRYGKFIACSGYPKCKYSRPLEISAEEKVEAAGEVCEKCGGKMILKEGRFGKFLACENYPKCKNTKPISSKTGIKCPKCDSGELVEKKTKRRRTFWGCSRYPECDYATWEDPAKKPE